MDIDLARLRDILDGNTRQAGLDTFYIFAGYAGLLAGLWFLWMSWYTWNQFRGTGVRASSAAPIYVIGACYPIGMFFKLLVIGPDFLRWHLADFGFSVAISLLIFHDTRSKTEPDQFWPKSHPWHKPGSTNRDPRPILRNLHEQYNDRKFYIVFCLVLSYLYEAVTGLLYRFSGLEKVQFVGNFDLWDIFSYTLGAAIATLCLRVAMHWSLGEIKAIDAEESVARRVQSAMRDPKPAKTRRRRRR
jgi:hypothetical protein